MRDKKLVRRPDGDLQRGLIKYEKAKVLQTELMLVSYICVCHEPGWDDVGVSNVPTLFTNSEAAKVVEGLVKRTVRVFPVVASSLLKGDVYRLNSKTPQSMRQRALSSTTPPIKSQNQAAP